MKDALQSPSKARHGAAPAAAATRRPITAAEGRTRRRTDALFRSLGGDYLLREQFVTDPAQVMSEYIHGARLPDDVAESANQLLYSVMSNARLRDWLAAYGRRLQGATPTRDAFAREFARAIATRGDEATTLSLIRAASLEGEPFVLQSDLLRAIASVLGGRLGSSGTEMSPGTGGTEMSPGTGTGGTEMSPGTGTGGTERSPGGTEMSPGAVFSGTEMSPGTGGTEMSPGTGGTEMSPGAVFSGTEMSPGTGGTEMSPGTGGTEMSPGAALGGLPGYLQVSLIALVEYASLLRARGALQTSGLEGR